MSSNNCFVPGCKTGRLSDRKLYKAEGEKNPALFSVPKEVELMEKWKKIIPSANRELSAKEKVCELHFNGDDIERYYITQLPNGETNIIERGKPRLKSDAVPSVFPDLPKCLSKELPMKPEAPLEQGPLPKNCKKNVIREFVPNASLKNTIVRSEQKSVKKTKDCKVVHRGYTRKGKICGTWCCVPQCNSAKEPEISFHSFPDNEGVRNQWILSLRMGKPVTKSMKVCSKHFKKTDYFFQNSLTVKRKPLKRGAVPSANLPGSDLDRTLPKKQDIRDVHKDEFYVKLDLIPDREEIDKSSGALQEECFKTVFEDLGSLSKDMETLLVRMDNPDVTLNASGRKLNAHRLILESRSPEFRKMFQLNTFEEIDGEIQIPDCDPDTFEDFLGYLYTGKVEISTNNVTDLHYISEKYETINLSQKCFEFIQKNLTVDSFCDFVSVALQSGLLDILETAVSFFSVNFKQITKSEKWKAFINSNPSAAKELLNKTVGKL